MRTGERAATARDGAQVVARRQCRNTIPSVTTQRRLMPVDEVFFDCDSTLSTIEGIDELARLKGVEDRIVELTNAAMDGKIPLQEVYAERLRLLSPTRADMRAIEEGLQAHAGAGCARGDRRPARWAGRCSSSAAGWPTR